MTDTLNLTIPELVDVLSDIATLIESHRTKDLSWLNATQWNTAYDVMCILLNSLSENEMHEVYGLAHQISTSVDYIPFCVYGRFYDMLLRTDAMDYYLDGEDNE